jgi:hypothetical protein
MYASVCECMRVYANVCECMRMYASVCECMRVYACVRRRTKGPKDQMTYWHLS